jgi:large subunit ribosomal protein L19
MDILRNVEAPHIKPEVPVFAPGDTIRVAVRVVEGDKVRSQIFQGVVVSRAGAGARETFTVRKISDGVAVERIFPLHSPNVANIELVRKGKVRRARLTYLRGRKGRSARIRERTAEVLQGGAKSVVPAEPRDEAELPPTPPPPAAGAESAPAGTAEKPKKKKPRAKSE